MKKSRQFSALTEEEQLVRMSEITGHSVEKLRLIRAELKAASDRAKTLPMATPEETAEFYKNCGQRF